MSSLNDSYSILPDNIFKFHQSHITIRTGYVVLFFVGCLFLLLGLTMFYLQVKNDGYYIDYTNCKSDKDSKIYCRNATDLESCVCTVSINITETIYKNAYIYYQLMDFNQNIRTYAKSYNAKQLLGEFNPGLIPSSSCLALQKVNNKDIVPCGLVPNSLFNDTFTIKNSNDDILTIENVKLGTDAHFKNPKVKPLKDAFNGFATPPNWKTPIYELDTINESNNGFRNFHFMSWMSVYPFSNALKLYGRISLPENYLPKGTYYIKIDYNFIISKEFGRKIVIINNLGTLGTRNIFMSIVYMIAASVSLSFSFIFFFYVKLFKV